MMSQQVGDRTTQTNEQWSRVLIRPDQEEEIMSQSRIAVSCPACSPGEETAHEVVARGGQATVRCSNCGHVHKTRLAETSTIERRVIISQDGEATEAWIDLPPDAGLARGDEFLVDTDEAILSARVTSLERTDGGRSETGVAETVKTVWARAVGNVTVKFTLHPKSGSAESTRSVKIQVPGDESFVVGETHAYGGEEFTVERLLLRDDATGYDRGDYDVAGDAVPAKDLKRVYARDETTSGRAWSGW